jgi:hypothetical protein
MFVNAREVHLQTHGFIVYIGLTVYTSSKVYTDMCLTRKKKIQVGL